MNIRDVLAKYVQPGRLEIINKMLADLMSDTTETERPSEAYFDKASEDSICFRNIALCVFD